MSLYDRYGAILRRRCERVLNNRADAEDLVHGLFADLIQKRRQDITFPYLFRAATNRCITHVTATKRRGEILEQASHQAFEYRYQLDDKVVDRELFSLLVDRLDKRSCEVLVYRFLDNMTHAEIAAMMGVSRRTINNYLNRIGKAAKKVSTAPSARRSFENKGAPE